MSELQEQAEKEMEEDFKRSQIADLKYLIRQKQRTQSQIASLEIQMKEVEMAKTVIELDIIRAQKPDYRNSQLIKVLPLQELC